MSNPGSPSSNWVNTNPRIYNLFPAYPPLKALESSPAFINHPDPFFGGQPIRRVFVEAAQYIDRRWQWGPILTYENQQLGPNIKAAEKGKMGAMQALSKTQDALVAYTRNQGFTVK